MTSTTNPAHAIAAFVLAVLCTSHVLADHPMDDLNAPDAENGKALYNTTCIACHGDAGKGAIPGVPDLRGTESRLAKKDIGTLLHNVLAGYQSPGSMLAMPPKGGNTELSRQDAIDILHYMRKAFCGED